MNKKLIMFFLIALSTLGAYVPVVLGESFFGGWSILGGFVGGLVGIWIGTWVSKRYGD